MAKIEHAINESSDPSLRPKAKNAFVAFRRFADDQLSSLMNLALGFNLYSNSLSLHPDTTRNSSQSPFKNRFDFKEYLPYGSENKTKCEDALCETSYERKENLRCPYANLGLGKLSNQEKRDLYSYFDSEAVKPNLPFGLGFHIFPQSPSSATTSHRASTPISRMFHSKCSLPHLEQDMFLGNREALWRAAFEDLTAFENGFELSKNPSRAVDNAETPAKWLRNMVYPANCSTDQQIEGG